MKYVKDDKREQQRVEKLLQKMATAPHVAVGILQDEAIESNFSMVDLALVHEFGSRDGHIPQRSFIRSTCDAKRNEHIKLVNILHSKIIDGKLSIHQALGQLGEVVEKDMVQAINYGLEPQLKAATIRRKKKAQSRSSTLVVLKALSSMKYEVVYELFMEFDAKSFRGSI